MAIAFHQSQLEQPHPGRARAIVKNIKAGQGMAVAFIDMGYPDRARLDQLLKKLV